jgi:hypothetical protein
MAPTLRHARRLVLALASLALAVITAREAAIAYWSTPEAARAPAFLRADPRLRIAERERDYAERAPPGRDSPALLRETASILRRDPLSLDALRLRALTLQGQGQGPRQGPGQGESGGSEAGAALLELAGRISRRDGWAQIALVDAAANRGDIEGALVHYDALLSVHPEAWPAVFPILGLAMREPAVGRPLAAYAARAWFTPLLDAALSQGDPGALTALVLAARRARRGTGQGLGDGLGDGAGKGAGDPLAQRLLAALAREGDWSAARGLIVALAGREPPVLADFGFTPETMSPGYAPLAWSLAGDVQARAEASAGGGLSITLEPGLRLQVAERVTLLPAGDYMLRQRLRYDGLAPQARLTWEASCLTPPAAAPFWRQGVPARQGAVTYQSRVSIPAGCAAQSWRLQAASADTQAASTAALDSVALTAAP